MPVGRYFGPSGFFVSAFPQSLSATNASGSAPHLFLDGVGLSYPGRRLLHGITFSVSAGSRTGLIGANGAGKSTLLRIAAGRLEADAGTVLRPVSTGMLDQEENPAPGATVNDTVEAAVGPVRQLEPALARLAEELAAGTGGPQIETAYDLVLHEAERTGLWALDARISAVLNGLGLGGIAKSRSVASLSGGQRRRLALAALLLERPLALLLDEPTNHLDDDAVAFLVAELTAWDGPVLMASHDRWFLDAAATDLIDLDPSPDPEGRGGPAVQGRRYGGGYSTYLAARAAELSRWAERWHAQETERRRLEQAADIDATAVFHTAVPRTEARGAKKFYSDKAAKTVGGRVRAARRSLEELERHAISPPPAPLHFAGPVPAARPSSCRADGGEGNGVLQLAGAGVPGRLPPVDLVLREGARLLVEGANGRGKSTLLALLAGTLHPLTGSLTRRPGVRIGLLAQDQTWPDPELTAEQAYRNMLAAPDAAPSLEQLGLLDPVASAASLRVLSPGQRRRVALAGLMAEPPEVLLLDEPTNHLSLALAEELEEVLRSYPGTVVLASHDRWIRRRWDGERLQL